MRPSRRLRNLLRFLWAVSVVLVFVLSLLPASALPRLPFSDKLAHFAAYALLAFLPALHESPRSVALQVLAVLAMGILIEFGQSYSVGRFSEVADVVANAGGAVCGVAVGILLRT